MQNLNNLIGISPKCNVFNTALLSSLRDLCKIESAKIIKARGGDPEEIVLPTHNRADKGHDNSQRL